MMDAQSIFLFIILVIFFATFYVNHEGNPIDTPWYISELVVILYFGQE